MERCAWPLVLSIMLAAIYGCRLSAKTDKVGRVTEILGQSPEDTRAVYIATNGSIAFEVLGRTAGDADLSHGARVRYVVVDHATVARALHDAHRRASSTPTTLPAILIGVTPGPPARVIPTSLTAPSATPADLPRDFDDARRIEWNGHTFPMIRQRTAVTGQAVELAGAQYLLLAGPYPVRQAHTAGGGIIHALLAVPAAAVDVAAGGAQYVLFFISGVGR